MPAHGLFELRQRFDLPPELLGVVLAQVEHARHDQRTDQLRRPLLRNRDQLDRRFSPARAVRGRRDPASNRFHIPANSIAALAQLCTLDDTPSGQTPPRGVVTTAVAPTPWVTKSPRLAILHDVRARKSMRFRTPITHFLCPASQTATRAVAG